MKEAPESSRHSTIIIHHRNGRSFYTRFLHFIVRHLRDYLGKPKEKQPKGCPRASPHKIVRRTCEVSERCVEDIYLYDIVPRHLRRKDKPVIKKRIYYFSGGGWQSPPSSQHWQLCAKLARDMSNTATTLVSYPLAPNNPAPDSFPLLLRLYRTLMRDAEEKREKVIFAGDSSGANIVLALVLEALREDVTRMDSADVKDERIPYPSAIMAICPSTDLTRSNPDIEKLKSKDPFLTPDFINSTARAWTGDWDATDRRVSPINADISLLAKRGIKVHGVTGGYDILAPDAIMFRDRLARERVSGEWLEWDQQMHCFVLTWPYGVPEGREGTGWIIDMLKSE
ncbi:alpha/beta-hydrolase [Lojkania enalia]|uniref:Alpha/beta-hydrolase n=1 Tax=Lojkania enalia TaxID=147567 RepID=A0A9P4N9Y6_9PLEO|nr:alpha/beta-hydrolase [Didymosphaeria enalia]